MKKKLGLGLLYAFTAYLIYLFGEPILDWMKSSNRMIPVTLLAICFALFPVIPYPVVGGVIGAAFGPAAGSIMTWIGSAAASILMFLFVRYGYRDWGARMLNRYQKLGQVTVWFEKHAFLTIFFARLVPFVPSIIINVYAALSRVSFTAYTVASSIGKIPAMLLFALIGDQLVSDPRHLLVTLGIYGLFLTVTLLGYFLWKRKAVGPEHREAAGEVV